MLRVVGVLYADFCSYHKNSSWRAKQNLTEMFPREDILRSAALAAIGLGFVTLVIWKLLEKNEETVAQREIRGENDLNEPPRKEPQENDERF